MLTTEIFINREKSACYFYVLNSVSHLIQFVLIHLQYQEKKKASPEISVNNFNIIESMGRTHEK